MTANNPVFVSFEPRDGEFVAFLPIEQAILGERDPAVVIQEATKLYDRSIAKMRSIVADIEAHRLNRRPLPARRIWELGNAIFELKEELERLSFQLDGLYDHLIRDLGVKRKWLEKVVILRRYLPRKDLIPEALNWGCIEKGTRRKAERLRKGLPHD